MFILEFNFRRNQSAVFTLKLVDFPPQPVVLNAMPSLLNQLAFAELELT